MDQVQSPASTSASTPRGNVAQVHKSPRTSGHKTSSRGQDHPHEGHGGKRWASGKTYLRHPISSAFKTKGDQDTTSPSSRLVISIVVALATVLVSALTSSIMTWLLPSGGSVHHLLTQQIQGVCDSKDCSTAVRLLDSSLNSGASACHDVYDFVCGRWNSTGSNGSSRSYYESLHDQYVPLAHNTLTTERSHHSYSIRPEVHQLVTLYRSCLAFFSNGSSNLQELWKAAGVDVAEWLNVTNFAGLVSLIVNSTYRNKMPSVVHIQWSDRGDNEDVIVRTGRSLKTDAPISDIVKEVLDKVPNALLANATKAEISAEFLRLEDAISNLTEASTGYEPALPVATTALDMPDLHVIWAPLLNRTGFVTTFMCNNVSGIRSIMGALASTQLRVAAFYALLVPFSALVGLDIRAAEHRGHKDSATKRKICLGSMELLLPKTFQHTLRKIVDVKVAMVDLFLMCKRLLMVTQHHLTIAKGVKLNATLVKEACTQGARYAEPAVGSNEAVLKTRKVWHGDDFAVNLVLYTGATGRAVNVGEMLVENFRHRRFVSLVFMLPDFYYSHATEPSINYATLGVLFAETVAEHAMPVPRPTGYKECFASYAKANLGLTLPLPDVDRVWRTRWAMIASQKGSSRDGRDLDLTASKRLTQLFYLRFAHTFCGERDKTRLLALRYAASVLALSCPGVRNCQRERGRVEGYEATKADEDRIMKEVVKRCENLSRITKSGLSDLMVISLEYMNSLPDWNIMVILCVSASVLTELTSDSAICMLMLPAVLENAVLRNVDPLYFGIPTTMGCSFAFMLPALTPPNAIVYHRGHMTPSDMVRFLSACL
ncbi:hypothetical protein HPB51_027828 [Rhipicephalus microplus]|uniref:Uncharacterized protein n=1 Tax=Rhipicephalus microplus TaxID=6941 RepID=A0A9J6CZ06_RHIMP|nr:hypothetical protein HPB51_027828 [Rhipicephalus microplus]